MSKFTAGQIIVATTTINGPFDAEIVAGNLYHAGHAYGHDSKPNSLWVTNEQVVKSVYPESAFERFNLRTALAAAEAETLERAAKVAERHVSLLHKGVTYWSLSHIPAAIRALKPASQQEPETKT